MAAVVAEQAWGGKQRVGAKIDLYSLPYVALRATQAEHGGFDEGAHARGETEATLLFVTEL